MKRKDKEEYPTSTTIAYSFAYFADTTAAQLISFLLFTFYYVIIKIDVVWIMAVMIIWSIWDAINDPLMGAISDRTNTKFGKRKPFIIIGIIPTCIILVLFWIPPTGSPFLIFIYILILLVLFDTFYTMYSLNQTALFPEMYQDLNQRAKANNIVQVIGVIALLFAFLAPVLFIPDYLNPEYKLNYFQTGLFMSIITAIAAFIFIKFGLKERKEFLQDSAKAPSFIDSLRASIGNKSFVTYVIANFSIFYVFGMITTLAALYGGIVLRIESSFLTSILLGLAFISAAGFMILWNKIAIKYGVKKGQMLSMLTFMIVLLPLLFVSDFIGGVITFLIAGIGLAGALFFRAVTMSAIVDEDELKTGVRREGSYFGVNALIIRLTTIAVSISIAVVLSIIGMAEFDVEKVNETVIIALRVLMVVFPIIALTIGLLSLSRFPINKEREIEVKNKIEILHKEKKENIQSR